MCFLILVNFGVMLTFLFSAIDLRGFFFLPQKAQVMYKKNKAALSFQYLLPALVM